VTREKAIAFAEENAIRSTSPSAHRSRSTRTCGAGRWRPASSSTCGMRRPDVYDYTEDPTVN
jgi:hypothetical protein